jgi:Icc-related predicted phosphoesterase
MKNNNICNAKLLNISIVLIFLTLFNSCATYHVQTGKNLKNPVDSISIAESNVEHTFYLIGDAGNANEQNAKQALQPLENKLDKASKNSTLIFLGDNVYTYGMSPDKETSEYKEAAKILENQLKITKNFKGKTFLIPGNHDWYSGFEGLKNQEEFVNDYMKGKEVFTPKDGCGIDDFELSDAVTLITINSQWFFEDWNDHPTINDDCSIKSREDFFLELESLIAKNENKTIILSLHHPLLTNGSHGGQFSLRRSLISTEEHFKVPVLGTLYGLLRKTSGISDQDALNKGYNNLSRRIRAMIQSENNIVVVSGHEHSLEYIEKDNVKQVVSGAGTKTSEARAIYPNDFSYGRNGYATLQILKDATVVLTFFTQQNGKEVVLYKQKILKPANIETQKYPKTFPKTETVSIYDPETANKSKFYSFLWGKHYRDYYLKPIKAQVATVDTLVGGLTPDRSGGGHQSNSLRLYNKSKDEYVLRALKKSASRFFQSTVFTDQYIEQDIKGTFADNFLMDFYTSSHPFTPFVIDNMARKLQINTSNPKLYYVPKHNELGKYNSKFGGELYMLEERPSDSQKEKWFFGKSDNIESTNDVFKKLRKDEEYVIDEKAFIKARLFDMLLGDWDRHEDQWKWAEYEGDKKTIFQPIPKDRDQAFPKYDGVLLALLLRVPAFKNMQTYKEDISSLKWLNMVGYRLDTAFLQKNKEEDWLEQAKFIQENLSDKFIETAFATMPKEVQDAESEKIQKNLKSRRDNLLTYAKKYHELLEKRVILVGTDKKEDFVIKKLNKNQIEVTQYRNKKDGVMQLINTRLFDANKTKEIWIYGLDDDDKFMVEGNVRSKIKLRIIGGQNNDEYKVEDGRNVKIYDYKTKKNEFDIDKRTTKRLSDDYEMNTYDYKKARFSTTSTIPGGGFNPDDGVKLGIVTTFIDYGFRQNPYTSKHVFKPNYYFGTNGFELGYAGHFPKLLGKLDFNIDARYTSPNFAINFFGFGNEAVYDDENQDIDLDFNRVKFKIISVAPSIKKVGKFGSEVMLQANFEDIEVENTAGRFIENNSQIDNTVFDDKRFGSAKISYGFENYDVVSLPTLGMGFALSAEFKSNLNNTKQNFVTLESKFNFAHKIISSGNLVFETVFRGKLITNSNYDFYHGATLGGNEDLRAYRFQRFLGNKSFSQSTDLRYTIGKIKRGFVPMKYGVIAGFDYGRVWLTGEDSNLWHTSYGGSVWINGLNLITAKLSYFESPIDKGRISFAVLFGF